MSNLLRGPKSLREQRQASPPVLNVLVNTPPDVRLAFLATKPLAASRDDLHE